MRKGALLILLAVVVSGQNSDPNPYLTIEGYFHMPDGRPMGATSAIDIDRDGKTIWVTERCGGNSCAGSMVPPVLKFDPAGLLLRSFGEGLILFPHGIFADRDGNVWVTDGRGQDGKGNQVWKFSPEGSVLMTLGKPGGGSGKEWFAEPNDVAVSSNGDIFVAEGHSVVTGSARIVKLDRNGKYLMEWGGHGSGPGQFEVPHALAFDSAGRLFVGDRGNNRVQIFDQSGKFIAEWKQFSQPSGLYIDKSDVLYVADSDGIRIVSAVSGQGMAFIPDAGAPEGVAVDAAGNVFGAETGLRALKKYVKRQR